MWTNRRSVRLAIVAVLLCAGQLVAVRGVDATTTAAEQCFTQTNQCISDPFLAYWQAHGGLAINGYPLTAVFTQRLEDGKDYQVQYFERTRLELHPENEAPYNILLGQFGRVLYLTDPSQPRANAASPLPGSTYFDATGHNVNADFLAYWEANGGLATFGLPVSEELQETLEDGKDYRVQYFERARFESHSENSAPYKILLGQFGRRIVAALNPNAPLPYLVSDFRGQRYRNSIGVRVRLGLPTGAEGQAQGVVQAFERGVMVYRSDTRTIYVAAKDLGAALAIGNWQSFPDTWAEDQPAGGGPAPVPNLYYPKRGFGKVWREHPEVQQLLGYATTPDEGIKGLVVQSFTGGQMVDLIDGPNSGYYPVTAGIYIFYANGRFEFQYHTNYP
jgi:hypothetical protein